MSEFSSLQRVLTTLSHKEPDKVPLFLLTTMHGAKELNLSIKDYFSSAENVVKGQLLLQEKYENDCLFPFFYASLEVEAMGGDVLYYEDGPPNSGKPIVKNDEDIKTLEPPVVEESAVLNKVLRAIELLKSEDKGETPIIGVVISPFSLPVMQMGFEKYLDLIYDKSELFEILMEKNIQFCVEWANAQLKAGATAICYFDAVSSPTVIPRDLYIKTGQKIAKKVIRQINGPTATHLASGRSLEIIPDIAETGTVAVGVSALENLVDLKNACRNKLTIIGNLNGIEMVRWTPEETEQIVKTAIAEGAKGGGFILSDNHGEIPYQVPDSVLLTIKNSIKKWGNYPLDWLNKWKKT